jgi:hypothetical protein
MIVTQADVCRGSDAKSSMQAFVVRSTSTSRHVSHSRKLRSRAITCPSRRTLSRSPGRRARAAVRVVRAFEAQGQFQTRRLRKQTFLLGRAGRSCRTSRRGEVYPVVVLSTSNLIMQLYGAFNAQLGAIRARGNKEVPHKKACEVPLRTES